MNRRRPEGPYNAICSEAPRSAASERRVDTGGRVDVDGRVDAVVRVDVVVRVGSVGRVGSVWRVDADGPVDGRGVEGDSRKSWRSNAGGPQRAQLFIRRRITVS